MEKAYISKTELAKCKGVATAFHSMFDDSEITILEDKTYGYIVLTGFDPENGGAEEVLTFKSAEEMFDELWGRWYDAEIQNYAKKTGKEYKNDDEVLADMPEDMKDTFEEKKKELKKVVNLVAKANDIQFNKNLHKYSSFTMLLGSLANLYAAIKKNTILSVITSIITGVSVVVCIYSGHKITSVNQDEETSKCD